MVIFHSYVKLPEGNDSMDFLEFMAKMKHGEFVSVQQDIFFSLPSGNLT